MDTGIIVIGNEVLSGETLDTNSQFLGKELNLIGLSVKKKISIPDERECIFNSINEIFKVVDTVIVSGGLGPTNDDITKKTLTEYFNTKLRFDEKVFEDVKNILKHRIKKITKYHKDQALIPEKAIALTNKYGTAPGLLFEENGKILISLPGIPFELKALMTNEVVPFLKTKIKNVALINKNIRTIAISESRIAEIIKDIEDNLETNLSMAYLPSLAQVKIRLTAKGENYFLLEKQINNVIEKIKQRIGEYIFGYDEITIPEAIGKLLLEKNAMLGVAESCTGGNISHQITLIPGSSQYFKGAVIAYSNEVKMSKLSVPKKTLIDYGAVSQQTAEAMAQGIIENLNTDFSIATTGIAGPDGGTDDKAVGTVWIAVASKNIVVSKKIFHAKGRLQNIQYSTIIALDMLRRLMRGEGR
ncbi:MAG: competence/damage-inducible protein A [Bacteroidota bacterium]|nr:competence/damage-inducible protein A [Bacteroidota bacterium]